MVSYTRKPRKTLKKYVPKKRTQYRRLPSRLSGSRTAYRSTKAISRVVNGMSENKLIALTSFDETVPAPIQLGALAFTKSFTIGSIPTQWASIPGLSALAGMAFPNGTGHSQRIGKYIYLQKTHFSMEIDTQLAANCLPTEFRVVILKARRSNNPMGISNSYGTSLFLAPDGSSFGHQTTGINGTDLMMQPLNKKEWDIRKDSKFMLSHAALAITPDLNTQSSGKYPVFKRITCNFPYYAKTEIINNVPSDLDTNYVVAIFSRSLAKDNFAGNWEVNTRGTTTFKDN